MDFLIFLLASGIMGRIEGRTIADYGLPWRRMFRVQYWQGVLLGFASITGLLVAMRAAGVFYFGSIALHGPYIWKWAIVYAFVFILVALREEFRARGYGLFTLSAGIGFWSAAILSGDSSEFERSCFTSDASEPGAHSRSDVTRCASATFAGGSTSRRAPRCSA